MIIHIRNGTNANFNAIQALERYFSTTVVLRQELLPKTETLGALNKAKYYVRQVVFKC